METKGSRKLKLGDSFSYATLWKTAQITQKRKVASDFEIEMQIYILCSYCEGQITYRSNDSLFQQSSFPFHEANHTKHTQAYIHSKSVKFFIK